MKIIISFFALCFAASAGSLPAFIGGPTTTMTRIGETILSGAATANLRTNRDTIYWETNVASGGVLPIYSVSPIPLSWDNREPASASFDGSVITFLQNGSAILMLKYGFADRVVNRLVNVQVFSSTAAGTNYVLTTNVVGSLAHHISTNIFARLTGSITNRRTMFSTWSTRWSTDPTLFVRNTNFFLADVPGIESYIAGNNSTLPSMNGCLISPRHILSVYHIGSQLGQVVYFCNRTNNSVISRTVIDYARIGLDADQTVGLLDSPVPDSIVPAAVITNQFQKLPQYTNSTFAGAALVAAVPVIAFNQDVLPAVHYLNGIALGFNTTTAGHALPSLGNWTQAVRGGDSGSPCMTIINNRMAVVGNWTVVGGGGCCWTRAADIQTTMNLLCARNSFTNETLSYLDTSGFTSY